MTVPSRNRFLRLFRTDTPDFDAQPNGLSYLVGRAKSSQLYADLDLDKGDRGELDNLTSRLL